MKKKVIFVTKALWIGGIETALVNLLNHFDYESYEVTLLVLHAELDMLDKIHLKCRILIADREKVVTFRNSYKYKKLYHLTEFTDNPSELHRMMMWSVPIIKWIENKLFIRYIRNLMKTEEFDTAIIYSDVVAEITIKAIKADKYLMFYHHGEMRHVYHDEIGYKKCNNIIAVSENQAQVLRKFVPQVSNKICTIRNLTDVDGIRIKADLLMEEVFDESKYNIVSVGRVSYEKGMDIAVCTCAKLVKSGYSNIRWWIVGDGPAMKEVQDAITETGMQEYVITVGMKSNPYPYIKKADLYVQPSRVESFGLTIKEAMVLGKPVVATDTLGAKEIIKNKINGVICSLVTDDLEQSIQYMINHHEKMEQISEQTKGIDFNMENSIELKKLELII